MTKCIFFYRRIDILHAISLLLNY